MTINSTRFFKHWKFFRGNSLESTQGFFPHRKTQGFPGFPGFPDMFHQKTTNPFLTSPVARPGGGDCGVTASCRKLLTGFPKREEYPEGEREGFDDQ